MTGSGKYKTKRTSSKAIPFELAEDEISPFAGFCPYHSPTEIRGNGKLKGCLEKECNHLVTLRPLESVPKEGIMYQIIIRPDKNVYKTKGEQQKAERELCLMNPILEELITEYVQLLLKEKDKEVYETIIKSFYRERQSYLKGCPLCEYPRPKKEKQKLSRKAKKEIKNRT
jgi:hypothetical protein